MSRYYRFTSRLAQFHFSKFFILSITKLFLNNIFSKGFISSAAEIFGLIQFSQHLLSFLFSKIIVTIFLQINGYKKPIFQLHAFVRWKLVAIYGLENVKEMNKDGPIPSHLLSKKIPSYKIALNRKRNYEKVKLKNLNFYNFIIFII